jgi:Carboxypeptidase regulatory-like domain
MSPLRVLAFASCLLVGNGVAAAQAATTLTPADPNQATAVREGKVVNQVTGAPLKKTVITLSPTGGALENNDRGAPASIETGEDGTFRFPRLTPGPYWMMAERAGFAPQYFNGGKSDNRGSVIRAHAGEEVKGLTFKLIPNAIISGKVLDPDGDPIKASVAVYRPAYRTSGKTIQPFAAGSTGALGEYSISVPPGKYFLVASPVSNGLPPANADVATPSKAAPEEPVLIYSPVFYPNSSEQMGAIEVPCSAGTDVVGMDFHMTKVKAYRVRGTVSGAAGVLRLIPNGAGSPTNPPQVGRVTEGGKFELPAVVPGTYYLTTAINSTPMIASQLVVVTDHHQDSLAIRFAPMPELKGTVTFEGAAPPQQAPASGAASSGTTVAKDPRYSVEGMQVGFDSFDNGTNPLSPVAKDGTFTIHGILPGRYHPWAGLGGGGRYVKSIRYDGQDIKDSGLDLTEGISGTVDIVMSSAAADVSGVVVDDDGKPCPGVSVVLIPESGAYLAHNSLTTNAQGLFDISYVRPGDYKVYALPGILYLAWFDKEYMKPYSSKAIAITVHENDKKALTLKLAPESQN